MTKDKEFYIKIGFILRTQRRNQKISQAYIANKLEISFQQIQKYETGQNRIPLNHFIRYCKILNLKPFETLDLVEHTLRN